ncbi:Ubiquitin-like modifier-activating enzyme ATG7 [Aphelenchoides fujianensis]|nr:Ubiquitin-like modifier-activating enzyme ATG7 [Aphelenchoides fujianensis]
MEPLQFVPLRTFVDPAFWAEVSRRRLEEWQLECPEVEVRGFFSIFGKHTNECTLTIGHDALMAAEGDGGRDVSVRGKLKLFGTLKDFKALWTAIKSGDALKDPSQLNTFYLIGFADVKHYVYYSAVCTPALLFPSGQKQKTAVLPLSADRHQAAIERFRKQPTAPFFLHEDGRISEFEAVREIEKAADIALVFGDPSSYAKAPGWPLRNLISAIAFHRPEWTELKVLSLRGSADSSRLFEVMWEAASSDATPSAVGWANPQHVNLKSAFDPTKLMENSVDMNLKLVRWRLVPALKLAPLAELRVLMLGAGTLGCNLARSLLGWGVRTFTFVDNSVVSYNNPVRQCLYEFADCKAGNRQKAPAAAEALRRIFPSVKAEGVTMKIPMPGHSVGESEKEAVLAECARLQALIREHDVVFLVMDSRESRWLPTALATKHEKLAITVALGFDTFVVVRHGVPPAGRPAPSARLERPNDEAVEVSGCDLGCYFCNDVTAPGNSMDDRTLDQNCTITRAGVSSIAAGIATELLAALVQHEQGARAPALLTAVDENSSLLGATPHQVRGFMSRYQFITPTSQLTLCQMHYETTYFVGLPLFLCGMLSAAAEFFFWIDAFQPPKSTRMAMLLKLVILNLSFFGAV